MIHLRGQVIELIRTSGLSRVTDDLVDLVQDSLRLETTPLTTEPAIGSSRIGGAPDLPPGITWPEWKGVPQSLIAQLNMAEIAVAVRDQDDGQGPRAVSQLNATVGTASPLESALPPTGMLYFFYAAGYDQQPGGYDPEHRGGWKVLYFDGGPESLRRVPLPDGVPEEARFRPCAVEYRWDVTVPNGESYWIERLQLSEDERSLYWTLQEDVAALAGSSETIHRLLGHADQIQNDMMLKCLLVSHGLYCGNATGYEDPRRTTLESGATDWRLLLQIDTDDNAGMLWGDLGRIYYWVKRDDLRSRTFDNVWFAFQCF